MTLALLFSGNVGADEAPAQQGGGAKYALLAAADGATPLPATGTVEVLFTPWDDAEGAVVRALFAAKRSVHVQAYLLTSRSVAHALQAAQARGVAVEILADREMLEKSDKSLLPLLADGGIPVWLETRYAAAHNNCNQVGGVT